MIKITKLYAPAGELLAKRYWIAGDGTLRKSAAANLGGGRFEVIELGSMTEFIELLDGMTTDSAIALGCPTQESGELVTERQKQRGEGAPDAITRTKKNFSFGSGEGVLLLDIDHRPDRPEVPTGLDLLIHLRGLIPELVGVEMVWRPSSSSLIVNTDTHQEVTGMRGQHVYVRCKTASQIEALGKMIIDRLWLQGQGFCGISKSGSILMYTLVDSSVFSPERIVYVSGAETVKPLQQQRPLQTVRDGTAALSIDQFQPLKAAQLKTIERLKQEAREEVRERAAGVREAWVEQRIKTIVDPDLKESARRAYTEAVERRVLTPDIELKLTSGDVITVADILENPDLYDHETMHDPLEWNYPSGNGDSRIATVYVKAQGVVIFSWAHGGTRYRIERRTERVCLNPGMLTSAVDLLTTISRDRLYRRGDTTVQMADPEQWRLSGFLNVQDKDGLRYVLGSMTRFYTSKVMANGNVIEADVDIDGARCLTFMSQARLQRVDSVIDHPIITPDGRVIEVPGLDKDTAIMLVEDEHHRYVRLPKITDPHKQCVDAFKRVYDRVLSGFCFSTSMDLTVAFAAMLTAVLRPVLPLTPAFLITAPVAGSGKTFLADVIARLAEGRPIRVKPFIQNEEELEKNLFAEMRSSASCVLLDNVPNGHEIRSAKLDSILTGETYSGRILGESTNETVPNRMVLFVTGNNISVVADSGRRWLKIRLDPRTDTPHRLAYKTDPVAQAMQHRQAIVTDLLTIVRCWLHNEESRTTGVPLISFGDWDAMVRQIVCNVAVAVSTAQVCEGRDDLPDLEVDIEHALCTHEDPEKFVERSIMSWLYERFKTLPFTTTQVREYYAALCEYAHNEQLKAERAEKREVVAAILSPFMTTGNQPSVNGMKLGKWIGSRVDKQISGAFDTEPKTVMILRRAPMKSGVQQYQIEVVGKVPYPALSSVESVQKRANDYAGVRDGDDCVNF